MGVQTIGLFEAKTHLSELVARAEQGDEVIITRHNRPVAKIVPLEPAVPFDRERRRQAVAELFKLRDKLHKDLEARGQPPITQEEIAEWIREGRK